MEMNQPLDSGVNQHLEISSLSRDYLKETAGWAKFLAICGFVFLGLFVLAALSIEVIIGAYMPEEVASEFPTGMLSAIYIFFAGLYFLPMLYLFRFATKMKSAIQYKAQDQLDDAFANIKSHYKFIGILMIIILGFYALGLISMLIFGAAFI